MSDKTIPDDAALNLLNCSCTNTLQSGDWSAETKNATIKIKLAGFVSSSTAAKGLMISAESPSSEPDAPTPSFMQLTGVHRGRH
jgi:hypothetical protein